VREQRREQEQPANTVRRAVAREEPGMRQHETEQRAIAREVPGMREQEQSANTVSRAIAREEPGVCPKRVGSFGCSTLASEEKASEK